MNDLIPIHHVVQWKFQLGSLISMTIATPTYFEKRILKAHFLKYSTYISILKVLKTFSNRYFQRDLTNLLTFIVKYHHIHEVLVNTLHAFHHVVKVLNLQCAVETSPYVSVLHNVNTSYWSGRLFLSEMNHTVFTDNFARFTKLLISLVW